MTTETGAGPREYIGVASKMAVDFITQRDLMGQVRAVASPEATRLLDRTPWPFAWHSSRGLDELETLIARFGGPDACVELGLSAGRKLGGTVIEPVLRMATGLFGRGPESVFANLDRFYSMVARGVTFSYQEVTALSGVVQLSVEGADVPAALFDVVRGNLKYVFELCDRPGSVDRSQVVSHDGSGAVVRFAVGWS